VQKEILAELAKGQQPYATIIGCSDSRVPPELVFGAGFGDLFIVRVAGNPGDVWGVAPISRTNAAAIEGAFFGIPSVAVSLEYDTHSHFSVAAEMAAKLIEQMLRNSIESAELFNINIPTAATEKYRSGMAPEVHIVPLGFWRYGLSYIKRQDPKGRDYYWSANDTVPEQTAHATDINTLSRGHVTITPLQFDLTKSRMLNPMESWSLSLRPSV
jgi:5'-nucleotidase